MATKVDICNMALATLGDTATVTSIDPPEGSAQADHCARFYPIALRDLLTAFPWRFATKRAKLAKVAADVVGEEDTKHYFALPSDCLRVLNLEDKADHNEKVPFAIEYFNRQKMIVTSVEEPWLRYITSEVDEALFSTPFTSALVHRLASFLAGPLVPGSSGVELTKAHLDLYEIFLGHAKSSDAREGFTREKYKPRYIGDAQMEGGYALD